MTDDEQIKEDRKLVTRVDEHGDGLTNWETDFVESCVARLAVNMPLTEKQRAVMTRIDNEKVS